MEKEKIEEYGKSKNGNFSVKDSIGVPHPYCIGSKHVEIASDKFNGMLGEEAIKEAEKQGIFCDICKKANREDGRKILSFEEHEQALLIECNKNPQESKNAEKELKEYLLKIKDKSIKDNFKGFAFLSNFE